MCVCVCVCVCRHVSVHQCVYPQANQVLQVPSTAILCTFITVLINLCLTPHPTPMMWCTPAYSLLIPYWKNGLHIFKSISSAFELHDVMYTHFMCVQ